MDDVELANLKIIRDIVDNKLFNIMTQNMKRAIADKMLETEQEEARDRLFSEAKALDRLIGELVTMANKYRNVTNV